MKLDLFNMVWRLKVWRKDSICCQQIKLDEPWIGWTRFSAEGSHLDEWAVSGAKFRAHEAIILGGRFRFKPHIPPVIFGRRV